MPNYDYTEKQGQYLAFIYNYTVIHGQPPSEADLQRFFRVSPPAIHQMVLRLQERGLITKEPRKPRTIRVLVPPDQLPVLKGRSKTVPSKTAPMQAAPAQAAIYQIKVTLDDSKPPVWRRVLMRGDVTLAKLHDILQVVMDWTNSHRHQFIVGQTTYGDPFPGYGFEMRDEWSVRLNQVAPREGSKFRYEHDFGDGWMHTLLVEKVLPPGPGQQYPVCIRGRRACPQRIWGVSGSTVTLWSLCGTLITPNIQGMPSSWNGSTAGSIQTNSTWRRRTRSCGHGGEAAPA